MWEDIVISIGEAVISIVSDNWLTARKRSKLKNTINNLISDRMSKFADTSLDCSEFREFITSGLFRELFTNFFCSTNDGMSNSNFMDTVEQYIYGECSHVQHVEVREFLHELQALYADSLSKVIEESPEMTATFQLLTLSHRNIMSKISDNTEMMMKYFRSLNNAKVEIEDSHIKSYHDVCKKEFGTIRFTGIVGAEGKKEQRIEEFYIENTFSFYSPKELDGISKYDADLSVNISLKDIFNYGSKIVVIGAAGLGKTTTLNYLFCEYEKLYKAFALKIKIDLKEYAREINENNRNLLWCLASEFCKKSKNVDASIEETQKKLINLLDEGKCLIILDALDEIPTQAIRNKVRDIIGNFCDLYFLNRIIISTREVGYLRNRFDRSFLHLKINDFNDEQIKQYSKNWYCSYHEEENFEEFWDLFLEEAQRTRCQNLIKNPIILILALVIFDIGKNLPNRRVEFYKKCIETFLTVREDRKAAIKLSDRTKNILGMDSVVPRIAHYKFMKIDTNVGYRFTYDELYESVYEAIEVEDRINWSESVKQYSKYLVERTELIRETDEDLLDFTHKTFYEYFLALYFAREVDDNTLLTLINNWIGDANYDELARLIVEVVIQRDESKHKVLMDYLLLLLNAEDTTEEKFSNKMHIFVMLADLYDHNMLHPRFHSRYYKIILYKSNYVRRAESPIFDFRTVNYDSVILADMYYDAVKNKGEFEKTLDSMFFLNDEFRCQVCERIKEEYMMHIKNVSIIVKNRKSNRRVMENPVLIKLYQSELKYFTTDGLIYTLQYPQIFLSIIDIMVALEDFSSSEVMFDYRYDGNQCFFEYIEPMLFLKLFSLSENNKNAFLLMLIAIVECASHNTQRVIKYLLKHVGVGSPLHKRKDRDLGMITYVRWFHDLLVNVDTYFEFKRGLESKNLYNSRYDEIYDKLFKTYYTYKNRRIIKDVNWIKD